MKKVFVDFFLISIALLALLLPNIICGLNDIENVDSVEEKKLDDDLLFELKIIKIYLENELDNINALIKKQGNFKNYLLFL